MRRIGEGAQTTAVIDASPEFRLQMNAAGARRLDALLLTHDHADQCHGIDDIRAFAHKQRERIPVWMDAVTAESLAQRFDYLFFGKGGYPAIGDIRVVPPHGEAWNIDGPSGLIPITTFDQDHGGMRSLGYRIGGLAYSSDVVELPEDSFDALADLEVWIVDALRWAPTPPTPTSTRR